MDDMKEFELIKEKYTLENVAHIERCKSYSISTPAVSFKTFIFLNRNEDKIFCVSQKNSFDDDAFSRLARIVRNHEDEIDEKKVISIISAKDINISFFDTVVALNSKAHNQFEYDVPSIYHKTVVIFPCHHSEFLGGDTIKEINYLRSKVISTLDWEREISPRVYLSFENYTSGVKTHSKDLTISDINFLRQIITEWVQGDSGSIKIKNYKGNSKEVKITESVYLIDGKEFKDNLEVFSFLHDWLKN